MPAMPNLCNESALGPESLADIMPRVVRQIVVPIVATRGRRVDRPLTQEPHCDEKSGRGLWCVGWPGLLEVAAERPNAANLKADNPADDD